jgi:hypothetical protein
VFNYDIVYTGILQHVSALSGLCQLIHLHIRLFFFNAISPYICHTTLLYDGHKGMKHVNSVVKHTSAAT